MTDRPSIATPTNNLEDAITAEAWDWADFFEVLKRHDAAECIEARKLVHRANAAVGYYSPLKGYYTGA